MTTPPPPRYRVVERGRRLEVIDTRTGEAVKTLAPVLASPDRSGGSGWPTMPEQEGFDGRALLTTHPWYDRKAPRRMLLDSSTMQWIGIAKGTAIVTAMALVLLAIAAPAVLVLLLAPLALLRLSIRQSLRTTATGWLDGFDEAPGR